VIGSGLVIDGNLESESSVRIDGEVRGRVTAAGNLELGPHSSVRSDVFAQRVSVSGSVLGNVAAKERVDLLAGARLTGDVRAPRFTIADGANFRGKVDMVAVDMEATGD
jgi:cytoskeletal protein CcmA (bactofilin family)